MKNFKILVLMIALLILCLVGCKKDEEISKDTSAPSVPAPTTQSGVQSSVETSSLGQYEDEEDAPLSNDELQQQLQNPVTTTSSDKVGIIVSNITTSSAQKEESSGSTTSNTNSTPTSTVSTTSKDSTSSANPVYDKDGDGYYDIVIK